jgi:hypothetical protein
MTTHNATDIPLSTPTYKANWLSLDLRANCFPKSQLQNNRQKKREKKGHDKRKETTLQDGGKTDKEGALMP